VIGAIYRFNQNNWNFDQVYAEMEKFDFYTRNGHGKQLDFVKNYAQQFQANQVNTVETATSR
jgi:hypothetical protein